MQEAVGGSPTHAARSIASLCFHMRNKCWHAPLVSLAFFAVLMAFDVGIILILYLVGPHIPEICRPDRRNHGAGSLSREVILVRDNQIHEK